MIPRFLISKLIQRLNNDMPCKTPCKNCKCKPCDYLPVEEPLYDEVDDKTFLPSTTDPRN